MKSVRHWKKMNIEHRTSNIERWIERDKETNIWSGTSPYPNHGEAQAAESPKDFIHKLRISLKELRETQRWLKLIQRVPLIKKPELLDDILQLVGWVERSETQHYICAIIIVGLSAGFTSCRSSTQPTKIIWGAKRHHYSTLDVQCSTCPQCLWVGFVEGPRVSARWQWLYHHRLWCMAGGCWTFIF